MRMVILSAVFLLAGLAATAAEATCIYPRPPESIPDGATATYEAMVAAQTAVKQFDADIAAYNACLAMELQALLASGEVDDARRAGPAPVDERGGLPRSSTSQNQRRNELPRALSSDYRASGLVPWPVGDRQV